LAINKRKILESAQKHLQRGALDKALEDYRTLLKADPHDSNVLLKVGDLYLKQGKRDEAINAYLRVAQHFTRDGFDAKAVALYKQISRLDPKRHDVSVPLADLYARMGLVPDAIAALQSAADAAYRAGDKDGALELLRRMAALDPANTQNRLKVAELFAKENRKQEAVAEYQAVADELERRGEEEERIRVLERMLASDPDRAPALLAVGRSKLATGQFAAARKLAERLLASQPDDIDGREILGHALVGEGETERARETFRELAELFRLRGDEAKARDLMQRFGGLEALAPDESDPPLDTDVPVLELEADAPEDDFLLEAEPIPTPAPKPAPARPAVLPPPPVAAPPPVRAPARPKADATGVETPRKEKPRREPPPPAPIATTVSSSDETADPDELLAEATVYLRYGKFERAVSALRTILALEPGHRAALENLGEALAALGETSHAVTAWQRAAEVARSEGEADVVERIRERIANVDPAAAEAFTEPAPQADADDVEIDIGGSLEALDEPEALAPDEDLDSLTIDLDGLEPLGAEEPEPVSEAPAAAAPGIELSLTPEEPTATTPARVTEDLEEAEFYFEQGLLDEARALYERILAAAPNHPQAMLRLGEIAARVGAPPPSPAPIGVPAPAAAAKAPAKPALPPRPAVTTPIEIELAPPEPDVEIDLGPDLDLPAVAKPRPPPAPPPPPPAAPPPALRQAEVTSPSFEGGEAFASGDFDLAAELSGAIGDELAMRTLAGTEEEAFESVFDAFKSGVERELGEGDHEARYDLGIAYKEMGLLEDALQAFQLAMAAPARRLPCLHMMGLCALELGRAPDAVAHLEQALSLPNLPSDQRVPLRYDAGRAYAALGDVARARAAFEEVRAADPSFGDVARELAALASGGAVRAAKPAARAETYESFDDLFGDDSEPPEDSPEPEPVREALRAAAPAEPASEAEEPPSAPAPADPTAPRRRRKISFV
jgi:pilus assembly protein FimV